MFTMLKNIQSSPVLPERKSLARLPLSETLITKVWYTCEKQQPVYTTEKVKYKKSITYNLFIITLVCLCPRRLIVCLHHIY